MRSRLTFQLANDAIELARFVGWIGEGDVVARGAEHRGVRDRVALEEARGVAQPECSDVGPQRVQAVGAKLDKIDALGAAREGLDPDRSGAREELQHARVGQIIAHHVEHGRAHVLCRGPDAPVLRRHEIAAGEFSGYDSHDRGEARIGVR